MGQETVWKDNTILEEHIDGEVLCPLCSDRRWTLGREMLTLKWTIFKEIRVDEPDTQMTPDDRLYAHWEVSCPAGHVLVTTDDWERAVVYPTLNQIRGWLLHKEVPYHD